MNKLIERITKVPLTTKVAAVAGAISLMLAANYFLVISDLERQIAGSRASLKGLERDLIDKKYIADNLSTYRRDKEVLDRRMAEALTELPQTTSIDELLRQLNDVGKKSGLEIVNLEPGQESIQSFYASIPIKMEVAGSYHEIAVFFESVSKLRRIVNISNLSFGNPTDKSEKVILKATYLATTFRFVDPSEKKEGPRKK
jgi:type IV pilus assembly protein PilO